VVNITEAYYWVLNPVADQNPQGISLSFGSFGGLPGLQVNGSNYIENATASGGGTISSNLWNPEPSTMMLMGGALIGLGVLGRKRRKGV
jgi:hypothetical protein